MCPEDGPAHACHLESARNRRSAVAAGLQHLAISVHILDNAEVVTGLEIRGRGSERNDHQVEPVTETSWRKPELKGNSTKDPSTSARALHLYTSISFKQRASSNRR